jgi:phosphoglycolate phosphatase
MRELINREHERHRELIKDDLPISSGVVAFIKEAARHYRLGIVSMAERDEIDYVLDLAHLAAPFSVFVTARAGLKHKPAPDCYQRALESLNQQRRAARELPVLSHECLVIEDSPPGIEAARAAGMRTIGVTNTVSAAELRRAQADVVTRNLADWNVHSVRHLFN